MQKWKMKNGQEIDIKDMLDTHLINSYKMIKRNGAIDPSTLHFYLCCDGPSGDMASYYFEQELDNILKSPVTPFVGWFEQELSNRNIEIQGLEEAD